MSQILPAIPRPAPADIGRRVELECMRMIYRQMSTSIGGHMAGISLLAVVFWPLVDHGLIATWFLVMTANQAWRIKLYFTFRITDIALEQVPDYARRWMIGAAISSACWSAASILFFIPDSPVHQTILITTIFAIISVAVPLIASHAPSFRIFVIPILVAMILRSGWEGDIAHLMLACVVAAMMLSVLAVGGRYYVFLNESLRRRFENEALAERLSIQNAELDRARIAAEQTSRAKTRFFAAASHDLRQPLHAIGLFVDLLSNRVRDSDDDRRLVRNIETSVRALESLFDALLDVSKIDTGAIRPTLLDFDAQALIERLRGDFEAEAGAKGLRLHLHAHGGPGGCFVHSDPLLVERILRNLIANAIHFTERGGVLVALRRRGDRLNVEIWDTGIGIAADQQAAIFEEFFQLGNPERDQGKGLGLGLSIVRRLTELLNLPISLRSQPGRGTRFRISLLIGDTANSAPVARPPEHSGAFSSRLILMINDDTSVRDSMTVLLNSWGAQVLTGATLDEVRTAAKNAGRPDMIICDYRLADGTLGTSIVADLREGFGQDIPAVVLTGTSNAERLAEAHACNYHLVLKPVPPSKLRALINASLADSDDRDTNGS
jgi:two-component system, sensor histidine kinase